MRSFRPLPFPACRPVKPPEQVDVLLHEKQAAKLLGVTPRALQAWRYRGGGPKFCRLGRRVRYRISDIKTWIAANTHKSTSEYSK
jgi:predicted DNA-binding transcriptional regulator AlpA